MSNLEHDLKETVSDAKNAVTAGRRHLAARLLGWLRAHPRLLAAIIASLGLAVVVLGFARG